MKSFLLILTCFLIASTSYSQSGESCHGHGKRHEMMLNLSPEDQATMMTLKMKAYLGFSNEVEPKVKAINLDFATRMQDAHSKLKEKELSDKMNSLKKERDLKLKDILPPDVWEKYMKHVEEKRNHREERRFQHGEEHGKGHHCPHK